MDGMPFLVSTNRNRMGLVFSASTVTPEIETGVSPFCVGSPAPVLQNHNWKNQNFANVCVRLTATDNLHPSDLCS